MSGILVLWSSCSTNENLRSQVSIILLHRPNSYLEVASLSQVEALLFAIAILSSPTESHLGFSLIYSTRYSVPAWQTRAGKPHAKHAGIARSVVQATARRSVALIDRHFHSPCAHSVGYLANCS